MHIMRWRRSCCFSDVRAACHCAGVADDIYAAGLLVAYMAFMPFCQPGSIDGPTIQVPMSIQLALGGTRSMRWESSASCLLLCN